MSRSRCLSPIRTHCLVSATCTSQCEVLVKLRGRCTRQSLGTKRLSISAASAKTAVPVKSGHNLYCRKAATLEVEGGRSQIPLHGIRSFSWPRFQEHGAACILWSTNLLAQSIAPRKYNDSGALDTELTCELKSKKPSQTLPNNIPQHPILFPASEPRMFQNVAALPQVQGVEHGPSHWCTILARWPHTAGCATEQPKTRDCPSS